MKKKILILGVSGYIGHHTQQYIKTAQLDKEYEILGVDIVAPKKKECKMTFSLCNLTNYAELESILTTLDYDYIINLIGISRSDDFSTFQKLNITLPHNILSIVAKNKIPHQKILLIGSAAEYGTNDNFPLKENAKLLPFGDYGLSKQMQSNIFDFHKRTSNLSINLARIFNIISKAAPSTFALGHFANQINKIEGKGSISTGDLSSKRDFIDMQDIIAGLFAILFNGQSGEIYNICSNQSFMIKELLETMISQSGKDISINEDKKPNSGNIDDSYGNNSKLKALGWKVSIDIEDTIKSMII
jgi:GDP-4-dehydro-6-deoxy-D-mannose reductase